MSSRAGSPFEDDDDDFGDVYNAMSSSSPVHPTRKHSRDEDDDPDAEREASENPGNGPDGSTGVDNATRPPDAAAINPNLVQAVKRYAAQKKLRTEQQDEVDLFLKDTAIMRESKLFIMGMTIFNHVDKIVVSQPPFKVSEELEKNINVYAVAILLSAKISSYKGSVVTKLLMDIIKKYRFDLPPNIERFPSAIGKVKACARDALTQKRSKFKKLLAASVNESVKGGKPRRLPDSDCEHIYDLARKFVDGTECTITVPLCCRIALMRKTFLKTSGGNFWDKLDSRLAEIREKAKGNAAQVVKAFQYILEKDREQFGTCSEDDEGAGVTNEVDAFQEAVDDAIRATTMNAASLAQSTGGAAAAGSESATSSSAPTL